MIKVIFLVISLALFSGSLLASPVNINTAGADQIANALKGIGPAKAAAIVAFRVENGPFLAIKDVANVKGIGKKTVEKNKNDIIIALEN